MNSGWPHEWRCTESTVKKEKLLTESLTRTELFEDILTGSGVE